MSPSDSKVSQSLDNISQSSIPLAHKEYEKILQQLEAECRHHIRCEQQMKLHIECLQEKLEQTSKDQKRLMKSENEVENLKKELKTFIDLSKKVE
jgi:predicted RNase H-like nuclease (RuvC/YqgF family)